MIGRWSSLVALTLLLASALAQAAPGVMIRGEDVMAAPNSAAKSVGKVEKGEQVEIVGRKGGWTQIRTVGQTGWVRLLSVRGGLASQTDVGGEIKGVLALGQRRDSSRVVAVSGVRGLNEEELRSAQYSESEIRRLDTYVVGRREAERFAADVGLKARDVAYIEGTGASSPEQGGSPWGEN